MPRHSEGGKLQGGIIPPESPDNVEHSKPAQSCSDVSAAENLESETALGLSDMVFERLNLTGLMQSVLFRRSDSPLACSVPVN